MNDLIKFIVLLIMSIIVVASLYYGLIVNLSPQLSAIILTLITAGFAYLAKKDIL